MCLHLLFSRGRETHTKGAGSEVPQVQILASSASYPQPTYPAHYLTTKTESGVFTGSKYMFVCLFFKQKRLFNDVTILNYDLSTFKVEHWQGRKPPSEARCINWLDVLI